MKDFFEYIEDYLQGRLSQEDKLSFEKEMAQNNELKLAVENYDIMSMIGDALIEEEIEGHIAKTLDEEQASSNNGRLKWLLLFVILIAIALIIKPILFPSDPPAIADLWIPTETPGPDRGNDMDSIQIAIKLHTDGNTEQALNMLNNINTKEAAFWITEIYSFPMQADSVLKYAPLFEKDKVYRDRVNFLKILAFYSQGAKDQYQELINNLPKDTDPIYWEKYKLID